MALPTRLFCDTSFFYACLDRRDVNHERAKQLCEEAALVGSALDVTWDIISEQAVEKSPFASLRSIASLQRTE